MMRRVALFILLAALALPRASWGALSTTPVFAQTPKSTVQQILPADTTTAKTIVTAGANGTKVLGIQCSNTDAAVAYTLQLARVRSATSYLMGSVSLPISAGASGAALPVQVFANWTMPLDSDGNEFFFIESGDTLTINVTVTVTAAKIIACYATQVDY